MQVDADGPSPTELAPSEDDADVKQVDMEAQPEKRKRDDVKLEAGIGSPVASPIPDGPDADLESPSKRPQRGSEPPLAVDEIRQLLCGHVAEMKDAWKSFQSRLDSVESQQVAQNLELGTLHTRTVTLEKDAQGLKTKHTHFTKKVDDLAQEVKNMKVQMGEIQEKIGSSVTPAAPAPAGTALPSGNDPWGDYLRRRGHQPAAGSKDAGRHDGAGPATNDKADTLTDDEKRTLVVGGWLRDTKRTIIEQEFSAVFAMEDFKKLVDSEKLQIYGPRRSVGMLKFDIREGEDAEAMKKRMWEVVRFFQQAKIPLESTKAEGDVKTIWASFVKTRTARLKSAHVSLIRRVTIALALDARTEHGSVKEHP